MTQFTQKYTIIQLFEDVSVGTQFSSNSWPLHSTIVDTFAIDWDVPKMIRELSEFLNNHPQATSTVIEDRFFGVNGQTKVVLLEKTDDLIKLHYDTIKLLQKGGLKLNDPKFAQAGYLPHSTVQPHARLDIGEKVRFEALSIIDMFPGEDYNQREVLATISISS